MITVEDLSKSFAGPAGTVPALRGVSFDVPPGSLCGVVGEPGAGKTTLARCVALVDRPDTGAVRIDGVDMLALRGPDLTRFRRRIGVVPEGDSLLRRRTAAGNVALPLQAANMSTVDIRRRVGKVLRLTGAAALAGAYPERLSAVERRRIALARGLATAPSVLLVDDPTAGLAAADASDVLDLLDRLRAEHGLTVLLGTSDLDAVRQIAEHVVVLAEGRVVEHGAVLDLLARPASRIGAELLPPVDDAAARLAACAESTVDDRRRVVDLVLVGYAAIGTLLPAATRHDARISLLGGGITQAADTPVTRVRIGVTGPGTDAAISWLAGQGATVIDVDPAAADARGVSGGPRRRPEVA